MKQRMASCITTRRKTILTLSGIVMILCLLLMLKVQVNQDLTKYLPDSSSMKQGIDILQEEFQGLSLEQTPAIRVMFGELSLAEQTKLQIELRGLENVSGVQVRRGERWSDPEDPTEYTLFTVSTPCAYDSPEEKQLEAAIREKYADRGVSVVNSNTIGNNTSIPVWIIVLAMGVLAAVLIAMSASWVEPLLFLAVIGLAIVINMGTNLLLGSISAITWSIAALMQLVLSMDYSVILMNRYRQEQDMEKAWLQAFPSIAGSGFTTIVGLVMLVFMRFKIGMDLGLVLAKGVLLSMVCVLLVLPALILTFEKAIQRTRKPSLHVSTDRLAQFEMKHGRGVVLGFAVLFIAAFLLQQQSDYVYSLQINDPIAEVFLPDNPVVLLYETKDEEAAQKIQRWLGQQQEVASVTGTGMLGGLLKDRLLEQMGGENHTLMMAQLQLPTESEETSEFLDRLEEQLEAELTGDYYMIGNSVMAREMQETFGDELLLITLLTAFSIFLVVAITFRNLLIPLLLVLIVQCGVFLTVMTTHLIGYRIYFLALLIVQCILMGATVDYGILFANYYRDMRKTMGREAALTQAYRRSIHTVLTSSLFLIFGTGSIGLSPADPTISQICLTLSLGALCTTLLILFVLPAMLCALDRWVKIEHR
ncbi:MAG: MMPL family transporter [Lachnospiraceae bacterium]|nr:MMPL family transporter [Lachnospiraceae bacterium]